jgi:caffeoyl-CoA O-methyltransferase
VVNVTRYIGILFVAAVVAIPAITCGQDWPTAGSEAVSIPKTAAEKRILSVLDEMDNNGRGMQSVSMEDGRVLRVLTEAIGAKHVVEIGTSHGFSAIWFCLALQSTGGKLTTHEIDPRRASMARNNFKRAGVDTLVTIVEGDAHKEVLKLKAPIDILFLDADKSGYRDYLNKLLPLVRAGGLIMAHNTSSLSESMEGFLAAVTNNPNLETVFIFEETAGISITLKKH